MMWGGVAVSSALSPEGLGGCGVRRGARSGGLLARACGPWGGRGVARSGGAGCDCCGRP